MQDRHEQAPLSAAEFLNKFPNRLYQGQNLAAKTGFEAGPNRINSQARSGGFVAGRHVITASRGMGRWPLYQVVAPSGVLMRWPMISNKTVSQEERPAFRHLLEQKAPTN